MNLEAFLPVLIQIILALGIAVVILFASHLFEQRAKGSKVKNSPYECGLPTEGHTHPRFAVKFYLTAMLFIVFDIEVIFLIPWVMAYRDFLANNIAVLTPMLFFCAILSIGLVYELKKGALEWDR